MKRIFHLLYIIHLFSILGYTQNFTRVTEGDIINGHYSASCSWGDYDNDGDSDLFVSSGLSSSNCLFYRNNGDGTFTQNTTIEIVSDNVMTNGSCWGDYDNDGNLDIILTNHGDFLNAPSYLYKNIGDGTFLKVSEEPFVSNLNYSNGCCWGDYDNDGYLDLFIANGNYHQNGSALNYLYHNNKDGSFAQIDMGQIVLDSATSTSGSWCDFDNDGDLDLFVTNTHFGDEADNFLYRNNGDGTFTKLESSDIGEIVADGGISFGGSWGDYDNDGYMDLFVSNVGKNYLYHNNGNGIFTKVTLGDIVNDDHTSRGSSWGDYDNDGDLDLFVANESNQNNVLYSNNGDGTFVKISEGNIVNDGGRSVGCGWADIDNDGDLDIFISNFSQDNFLYINDENNNNWINIKCIGSISNTSAIGTKVKVKSNINGTNIWQVREILSQSGYISQNSVIAHFGLGDANVIDSIRIEWPSGYVTTMTNIVANRFITLTEDDNIPPDIPQNLIAISGYEEVLLTWSPNIEMDLYKYNIYRCSFSPADSLIDSVIVSSQSDTSCIDSNLVNGQTYFYRITAVDSVGNESGFSDEVSGTPYQFSLLDLDDLGYNLRVACWGDYDNDDDLDILLSGNGSTFIAINDNNTFIQGSTIIENSSSYALWRDFNNDGWLDIILPIYNIGTSFYTNNNGNYTKVATEFESFYGRLVPIDYDNDGDLDILASGLKGDYYSTTIYVNVGNNNFQPLSKNLYEKSGFISCADYDNDNDDDVLYNGNGTCIVFQNDGKGNFSDQIINIEGMSCYSVDWGDYDNDGDLDVAILGLSSEGYKIGIYRNDGQGVFHDISGNIEELEEVTQGSIEWGDCDNDGLLDLLYCGIANHRSRTKLYRNIGNDDFVDSNELLYPYYNGVVRWGDYDNDGDLDIVLAGDRRTTRIYQNNYNVSNNTPNSPINLHSTVTGGSVTLSWDTSSDTETPASGLSYNLRIGSQQDSENIMACHSNILTGFRRIVEMGNCQQVTNKKINNLIDGTYYWNVQAIDNNYSGSDFFTEQIFIIDNAPTLPPHNLVAIPGNQKTYLSWLKNEDKDIYKYIVYRSIDSLTFALIDSISANDSIEYHYSDFGLINGQTYYYYVTAVDSSGNESDYSNVVKVIPLHFIEVETDISEIGLSSVAWGDYDNDGDLDILLTGWSAKGTTSKIYRNDGGGIFTDISAGLIGVESGAVDWGDYDNDGDLDILLTGLSYSGIISKIYRNDGNGIFTDISAGLIGVSYCSVAWGDYDNDGDLDILISGRTDVNNFITKIYRNDGVEIFTDISAGLIGVEDCSVAWGDYDNDGDLDILLTGSGISKIYRNDGHGIFVDINAGLIGVSYCSVAWGDYDNDGDLDILITGSGISKIYRNDGGDVFTNIDAGLLGVSYSSVAWGDYDNDGDLDILITGSRISKIYRNDDNNIFADMNANLTGVSGSSAAWGDYDNDGDLDILLTGLLDRYGKKLTKLYCNHNDIANSTPIPPFNLDCSITLDYVTFFWDNSDDRETPMEELSYNLKIGTTKDGCEIMPAHANILNGYRLVVAMGNVQKETRWEIKNLIEGMTYYWSVQSVDNGYFGSEFSPEKELYLLICPESPKNLSAISNDEKIYLKWSPNTEGDLNYYKIIRNTVNDSLNADSISAVSNQMASFIDSKIIDGIKYFYWISAVDTFGNESNLSNVVSEIVGSKDIILSGSNHYFKKVAIDSMASWNLYIKNMGSGCLTISDITHSSMIFGISNTSNKVEPLDSIKIIINFIPPTNKMYFDTLRIYSNDSDKEDSVKYVYLSGSGNTRPVGVINSPQEEKSGDIELSFQLMDNDLDTISVSFFHSVEGGTEWQKSTIIGKTENIALDNVEYNGSIIWNSGTDLPSVDLTNVLMKIIPSDSYCTGVLDISEPFHVDNYHAHSIVLESIPEEVSDSIQIHYKLNDPTRDFLSVNFEYSNDFGQEWNKIETSELTDNLDSARYIGHITWPTNEYLPNEDIPVIWVRAIPNDNWSSGIMDTIQFHLDNETGPLLVYSDTLIYPTPHNSLGITFDRSMDLSSFKSDEDNLILRSTISGVIDDSIDYVSLTRTLNIYSPKGFFSMDTLSLTLSGQITDTLGKGFDGNRNGDPEGAGIDDTTLTVYTQMLVDFDGSGKIDDRDINLFVDGWRSNNYMFEIGPTEGTMPQLRIIPDQKFNIDDLMSFILVYNWMDDHRILSKEILGECNDQNLIYFWDGQMLKIGLRNIQDISSFRFNIEYDNKHLSISNSELLIENPELNGKVLNFTKSVDSLNIHNTHVVFLKSPVSQTDSIYISSIPITFHNNYQTEVNVKYIYFDNQTERIGNHSILLNPIPSEYVLYPNYPNPFNPQTKIKYGIPVASIVHIDIYNILGQKVRSWRFSEQEPGYYEVIWDSRSDVGTYVSSGVYFYCIHANDFHQVKKCLLIK